MGKLYDEITRCAPADVKTPNAGDYSLFFDTTNSDKLSAMDASRFVTVIGGGDGFENGRVTVNSSDGTHHISTIRKPKFIFLTAHISSGGESMGRDGGDHISIGRDDGNMVHECTYSSPSTNIAYHSIVHSIVNFSANI